MENTERNQPGLEVALSGADMENTRGRTRRTPKKGERDWPARHTLPPALAAALRETRQARGLGLREAAREIGIWPGYLCLIEQGKRCPSLPVAHDLIKGLGLEGDVAAELLAVARGDAGRSRQTEFDQQERRERAAAADSSWRRRDSIVGLGVCDRSLARRRVGAR